MVSPACPAGTIGAHDGAQSAGNNLTPFRVKKYRVQQLQLHLHRVLSSLKGQALFCATLPGGARGATAGHTRPCLLQRHLHELVGRSRRHQCVGAAPL